MRQCKSSSHHKLHRHFKSRHSHLLHYLHHQQVRGIKTYNIVIFTGTRLSKIVLHEQLVTSFLQLVQDDVQLEIETCGLLYADKADENTLTVTSCILPDQIGHPNTFNVTELGNTQLVDFCNCNQHLSLVGWIHTHPTQDCFLSSVDLHTQFLYQTQVEVTTGIAIVVAPRRPGLDGKPYGVFSMTQQGMLMIQHCNQSQELHALPEFHPHESESPLYLQNPPHVITVEHGISNMRLVDMRKQKDPLLARPVCATKQLAQRGHQVTGTQRPTAAAAKSKPNNVGFLLYCSDLRYRYMGKLKLSSHIPLNWCSDSRIVQLGPVSTKLYKNN